MKEYLFAFFAVCFICSPAFPSFISLETKLNVKAFYDNFTVNISSKNKGDESAFNVQAEIIVDGKKILLDKKDELKIGEIYNANKVLRLNLGKGGEYPLILIIHYTDANQYPFSALTAKTFSYNSGPLIQDIFGKANKAAFEKEGKLEIILKNMSDKELTVNTSVFAPRELTVENNIQEIVMPAKSEKSAEFNVKNFSALNGSSYQVFAISSYEKDGIYRTSILPATISINESKTFMGVNYTVVAVVFAALAAIFALSQFAK